MSHCDEEADEGNYPDGKGRGRNESPATGIRKSNDERFAFILVASRYVKSILFFFRSVFFGGGGFSASCPGR